MRLLKRAWAGVFCCTGCDAEFRARLCCLRLYFMIVVARAVMDVTLQLSYLQSLFCVSCSQSAGLFNISLAPKHPNVYRSGPGREVGG